MQISDARWGRERTMTLWGVVMATEMGEYLVGAYLRLVLQCGVVDYNARPPGGGLPGLGELDVIGFNFASQTVYLCEVTTHLDGLLIGKGTDSTLTKLAAKHRRQQDYATQYLKDFTPRYMFWSPVVRAGLVEDLKTRTGFELFINKSYSDAINQLRRRAKNSTADFNNPAFRVLQILEHLRPVLQTREHGALGVAEIQDRLLAGNRRSHCTPRSKLAIHALNAGISSRAMALMVSISHWRAKHNDIMTYEEAWPLIKSGSYSCKAGSQQLGC